MLDLASAVCLKPAPNQRVMRPHKFERRTVTETHSHLGRTDDVREHDGPQGGVYGGGGRAWYRTWIADTAEECLDSGKIDRNDGVGDFTMRLTMDSLGGFGVRRMDEAERSTIALVEPIGHVFYALSVLNVDVPAVRFCDVVRLKAAQVVTVHENRHGISSVTRRSGHVARSLRPASGRVDPFAVPSGNGRYLREGDGPKSTSTGR